MGSLVSPRAALLGLQPAQLLVVVLVPGQTLLISVALCAGAQRNYRKLITLRSLRRSAAQENITNG